jgi:DNA polymerase-4
VTALCRDCGAIGDLGRRCAACRSPRLVRHPELAALGIAHLDCDAFYASVEKRDDPALADRPVIVGGGTRGVVAACCYLARMRGVRSAMPMFKALKACPDAVVIRPNMAKYAAVGREVRRLMLETTPLVQPISIDEAFLDLTGTERLHGGPPSRTLALLARRVERELGITISIGLSYNKFLAKLASDLDKPRGYAVIGRAEALDFLKDRPVTQIWGVGPALERRLAGEGIIKIGQLREFKEAELVARYGAMGRRLHRFARGEDERRVEPERITKSVSAETTFDRDIAEPKELAAELWPLCETVARRLVAAGLAAGGVTLKLKTPAFRIITRAHRLPAPTQRAELLFREGLRLLEREAGGAPYRLIGIGADALADAREADPPDLFDKAQQRDTRIETTLAELRRRLGDGAVAKGRGFEPKR